MRKTLSIILSLLMVVAPLSFGIVAVDGTAINDSADFAAMDPAGTYYLNKDITVSETYAATFTGTLDGNGHKITAEATVFAMLDGATIKNLTLAGALELENVSPDDGGAVLANKSNSATLTNIVNNASLTIKSISGNAYVGTLIGSVAKGTLIVTDCVNNGALTLDGVIGGKVAPRLGGLTGNVAKGVVPTFTNCVNNGNLIMHDTSETVTTGACYFGGISSDCFCGTFDHCVNNGNLTANVPLDGAGICGRTPPSKQLDNHSVTYTYCVNNGDVITSAATSRAIGGIQGYAGAESVTAVYTIDHCTNTGKISYTNPAATGNIGGLAGYVYGTNTQECAKVTNCINTGDVSAAGKTYVSEFLGYSNSNGNVISCNIGLGKLSAGVRVFQEEDVYTTVILGGSSADLSLADLSNNFILDTAGLEWKTWTATETNAVSRVKAADAPAGDIIFVTAAQVASGEVAYLANTAAGANCFFQNIDEGTKDAIPVIDDTHGIVYNNDGSFSNTLKCKHTNKTWVDCTATCLTAGAEEHYECADCLLWISKDGTKVGTAEDFAIEALGHKCTSANANGQYICERCGLFAKGKVYNETDFLAMAPEGGEFTFAADFALTQSYPDAFKSSIDGAGHTVTISAPMFTTFKGVAKNFTIAGAVEIASGYAAALCPSTSEYAYIENLTNNASVSGPSSTGAFFGYVSAGTSDITVKNCVNNGAITGGSQTGSLIGYAQGKTVTITDCVNNGAVVSTGNYAGGIISRFGKDASTLDYVCKITNCTNNGSVHSSKSQTGGIIAYTVGNIQIDGCTNRGEISADAGVVAGIFGKSAGTYTSGSTEKNSIDSVVITNCMNFGKIIGVGNTGGIAGHVGQLAAKGTYRVEDCQNYGEVTIVEAATGSPNIAGIAGYIYGGATENGVIHCQNFGKVHAEAAGATPRVAGIIGYVNSTTFYIQDNTNKGNISADCKEGTVVNQLFYNKSYANADYCSGNKVLSVDGAVNEYNGGTDAEPSYTIIPLHGDVNGDGTLSTGDVLTLRQYLANYNFNDGTSTVTVADGADVNGDGSFTSADVLMLRQYWANYDFDYGYSTILLGETK